MVAVVAVLHVAGHHAHLFEAGARGVGLNRDVRSVVVGVHGPGQAGQARGIEPVEP